MNAIPDRVIVESYVRGSNFSGILEANKKINRALIGGALSIGANVEIQDMPGYAPLNNSREMMKLSEDAVKCLDGVPYEVRDVYSSGCTDMGDLSVLMPVVHPYAPGACGISHGSDYFIKEPGLACVMSAKWQLEMLRLLLENGAERARAVIAEFEPMFKSKEEYFEYIDGFECSGDRISYGDTGASIKL